MIYNKKQIRKVIVSTVCITSLLWGIPVVNLAKQSKDRNLEITQLKEDLSLIEDKEVVRIARTVKESGYTYKEYITGYSDQISELEASLDDSYGRMSLLERKIDTIKDTYSVKLDKMEYPKYHLNSDALSDVQLQRADDIAHLVATNYEKYGVLPSVALGQAMQETQIGIADTNASNNYGYWGVMGSNGYAKYQSLYDGVMSYLRCINNGLYDDALFNKDYKSTLLSIQNGGYCHPKSGYAEAVIKCIDSYGFTKYDDYYLGGK